MVLHQNNGWASGGWMSDSVIDGNVDAGSQQQWISRNSEWGSWTGANWNMVFVGMSILRPANGPRRPTPRSTGHPSFARNRSWRSTKRATGAFAFRRCAPTQWASPGTADRLRGTPSRVTLLHRPCRNRHRCHDQRPARAGKRSSLHARASTTSPSPSASRVPAPSSWALGFATLNPYNGTAALTTADADGINLAGLLIDAGGELARIARSWSGRQQGRATPRIPSPPRRLLPRWAEPA